MPDSVKETNIYKSPAYNFRVYFLHFFQYKSDDVSESFLRALILDQSLFLILIKLWT